MRTKLVEVVFFDSDTWHWAAKGYKAKGCFYENTITGRPTILLCRKLPPEMMAFVFVHELVHYLIWLCRGSLRWHARYDCLWARMFCNQKSVDWCKRYYTEMRNK